MRIFVTGSAGWTARAIIMALKTASHEVAGFDLQDARYSEDIIPSLSTAISGDLANFDEVQEAVRWAKVDAILHLGIAIGQRDYENPDIPFGTNVKGTYNLLEAARRHGVDRTILIGSAGVHLPRREDYIWDARNGWRSSDGEDHLYDLTKRLQEQIAKDFCRTFGMRAVVLRAGHLVDGRSKVDPRGRALADLEYCRGGWLCRYDLAQACLHALELDLEGYNAFHVIGSQGARAHFDIDRTESELGMAFESQFEAYP